MINLKIQARPRNLSYATNPLERDKLMPSWSSDVSWDTRITNWNFEWPPRGIGLRGVALYHSIITPFRCVTFTRGPKYLLHRAGQSRGRAKMMRKTYVAFWALHINAWLFFTPLTKVIYTKYSKHWPYTVAHTIDCVCSKMFIMV